jgi:HD superfamily phosphohydrolase
MVTPLGSQFDPNSSFSWIFDAIHGAISIEDATPDMGHIIKKLLSSPVMERLRRIKQVPFAPQSYLSGDHSRYAHSLGTMHVTRLILEHLHRIKSLTPELYASLHGYCPEIFSGSPERDYSLLLQHMLVAALLQDVGELPFGPATKFLFMPDPECIQRAHNFAGFDVSTWSNKRIFTIACLTEESIANALEGLNRSLLVFLITGYHHPHLKFSRNLLQLHNILDSVVDADRMDYVFRDSHHTIGGFGTPNPLIESLLCYDEHGVIVRDPGPISLFLAERGHLYATVYLAPTSRFRTVLMTTFLRGMILDEYHGKQFFGNTNQGRLSTNDFVDLDDVALTQKIQEYGHSSHRKRIVGKSAIALQLLSGDTSIYDYEFSWLPCPQNPPPIAANKPLLPDQLFYDTFTNASSTLYEKGSVRVQNNMFRQSGNRIPLEEYGGPFTAIFQEEKSSVLPMRDSILLYTPIRRPEGTWIQYNEALSNGSLYTLLLDNDPFNPFTYPLDTRKMQNFRRGNIFISYTGADRQAVKQIIERLYKMKCRYYLYLGDFQGIGKPPSWNSTAAVTSADAVLLVASKNYVNRLKEAPEGNVAREWREMCRRTSLENLAIGVIPLDDEAEIDLPWRELRLNEPPFSGIKPLRSASSLEMEEAIGSIIDELLKSIHNKNSTREKAPPIPHSSSHPDPPLQ